MPYVCRSSKVCEMPYFLRFNVHTSQHACKVVKTCTEDTIVLSIEFNQVSQSSIDCTPAGPAHVLQSRQREREKKVCIHCCLLNNVCIASARVGHVSRSCLVCDDILVRVRGLMTWKILQLRPNAPSTTHRQRDKVKLPSLMERKKKKKEAK